DLKKAIESDDVEDIKTKTEALTQVSMKLGEAMYKAAQEQSTSESNAPSGEEVVDADFEEVDGDDKESRA
ncbi:MAG: hypothetical protein WBD27_13465, partial [Pyrinomonadaceae bacterium]